MRRGACEAIGCRASVLESELFCARCLHMVESDARRALGRLWRPGQKHQSATFHVVLETARREILYFQTNGHPVPRDRPFEWDDDEVSQL